MTDQTTNSTIEDAFHQALMFYAHPDKGATHYARLKCGISAFLRSLPPGLDIGTVSAEVNEAISDER